jgi:hypothetical protein
VDTTPTSAGYVYAIYTADAYWNIEHNLSSWDIMIQCYDFDRNLVFPAEVKIKNENKIQISFHTPQRGFALLMAPRDNFINTTEASASWVVPHNWDLNTYDPGRGVLTDFYLYNREQVVPSNIEITSVDDLEARWYVPTLGYCFIREYEYLHVQRKASKNWYVKHDLGYDGIFIQCFDMYHNMIQPYNIKLNKYTKDCTISFRGAVSGYVIVTAVGNTLTKSYIIESITAGGYIEVGSGDNPHLYDVAAYDMIKEKTTSPSTILSTSNPLRVTEDINGYYILGNINDLYIEKSITEMGLYTAEDDLIFYTYINTPTTQLYKSKEVDLAILYRILK